MCSFLLVENFNEHIIILHHPHHQQTFINTSYFESTTFTYRRQQLRRGRLIGDAGRELDARPQIEVADLDRKQLDRIDAQNILWLQVAMCNALLVQEIQTGRNLFDDLRRLVLREAHLLLDSRQQLATIDL